MTERTSTPPDQRTAADYVKLLEEIADNIERVLASHWWTPNDGIPVAALRQLAELLPSLLKDAFRLDWLQVESIRQREEQGIWHEVRFESGEFTMTRNSPEKPYERIYNGPSLRAAIDAALPAPENPK